MMQTSMPQGARAGRGHGALVMIRAIAITMVALVALGMAPAIAATARAKKPVKRAPVARRPPPVVVPPAVPMPITVMPPAPPPPRPSLPPLDNPPGDAAQPLVSPGEWVTDADYPPQAKRQGEQGRVVVRMAVDRKGLPYRCWVVSGSGSQTLDATTCYLMQTRARFTPAQDPSGKPMEWTYQVSFRWMLSDEELQPAIPAAPPTPAPAK